MSRSQTIKINLFANQLSGQYEKPMQMHKKIFDIWKAYRKGKTVNICDGVVVIAIISNKHHYIRGSYRIECDRMIC